MQIRRATAADASDISELIRPVAARFIASEFSDEGRDYLFGILTPQALSRFFAAGYRYHVAEAGGRLVGVVGTRDNAHLYHFFVDEQFQGRGIGKRLWDVARQACLDAGGGPEFTVASSRYAVPVYRRLGFEVVGPENFRQGIVSIPMRLSGVAAGRSPSRERPQGPEVPEI